LRRKTNQLAVVGGCIRGWIAYTFSNNFHEDNLSSQVL